jgi:hypothetical protein
MIDLGNIDENHKAISEKINSIEERMKQCKNEIGMIEAWSKYKVFDPTKLDGLTKPRPRDVIEKELGELDFQLKKEWNTYWSTEFIGKPLYLNTVKSYVNDDLKIEVKKAGSHIFYLFEGGYCNNKAIILLNEKGVPFEALTLVQNSETNGLPIQLRQKVILDDPEPVPEQPKHRPSKLIFPIGNTTTVYCSRCGFGNNVNVLQCVQCGKPMKSEDVPEHKKKPKLALFGRLKNAV